MKRVIALLFAFALAVLPALAEDYLSDRERYDSLNHAIDEYRFSDAISLVDAYIDEYNPETGDTSFAIKEILERVSPQIQQTYLDIDTFDGTTTLRFNDYDAISESVCVVPYMRDGSFIQRFGFICDNWLFFDELAVSVDRDVIIDYEYGPDYERQRDVIESGVLREMVENEFYRDEEDEFFSAIADGDIIVIRFSKSDTDNKFDHVMTEAEKNALLSAYQIHCAIREISDITSEAYIQYFRQR